MSRRQAEIQSCVIQIRFFTTTRGEDIVDPEMPCFPWDMVSALSSAGVHVLGAGVRCLQSQRSILASSTRKHGDITNDMCQHSLPSGSVTRIGVRSFLLVVPTWNFSQHQLAFRSFNSSSVLLGREFHCQAEPSFQTKFTSSTVDAQDCDGSCWTS